MSEKTYKVRVETTHRLTERALRGLWRYHRPGVEFSLPSALGLARKLLSDNPELETQIHEGREALEREKIEATQPITRCQASRGDGECNDRRCPQIRDGEPEKTERDCPLLWGEHDD